MTTRQAELLMALLMGAFSIYLMWKSTELSIAWDPDEGPGGGFWPFWLATVMLGSCIWIVVNWVRRIGPIATSTEAFFGPGIFPTVATVAAALTITIMLFDGTGIPGFGGIGVYFALPLFLMFYMRFMGNHSWVATLIGGFSLPIVVFLFFEAMLSITLPKGASEPLFTPVYARLYTCPNTETTAQFLGCLINPDAY